MTQITFSTDSIYELQINDEVWIGNVPYFVRQFSRGGMGFVVFLRRDDERAFQSHVSFVHGSRVAIKTVLLSDEDTSIRDLFQRELTVWSGLCHPNIVQLNEILTTRSDGWVASMDWCVGSLRQFLDNHSSLSMGNALFIARDIVEGLHYSLRERGMLHLDLKPGNILYKPILNRFSKNQNDPVLQYSWMVSDWGISSIKDTGLTKLTKPAIHGDPLQTFNNLGTAAYMAPERFVSGIRSSVASDLFAVGLVLYEMLMGGLPYQKSNPNVVEQLRTHSYYKFAQMTLNQQRIPKLITEIILDLINPDPDKRYGCYLELIERINQFQRPRSFLSRIFNP